MARAKTKALKITHKKRKESQQKNERGPKMYFVEYIIQAKRDCTLYPKDIKRYSPFGDGWIYLVKWAGYPHSENSWLPGSYLRHCEHLVRSFWDDLGHEIFINNVPGFLATPAREWKDEEKERFARLIPYEVVETQNANPRRKRSEIHRHIDQERRTASLIVATDAHSSRSASPSSSKGCSPDPDAEHNAQAQAETLPSPPPTPNATPAPKAQRRCVQILEYPRAPNYFAIDAKERAVRRPVVMSQVPWSRRLGSKRVEEPTDDDNTCTMDWVPDGGDGGANDDGGEGSIDSDDRGFYGEDEDRYPGLRKNGEPPACTDFVTDMSSVAGDAGSAQRTDSDEETEIADALSMWSSVLEQ